MWFIKKRSISGIPDKRLVIRAMTLSDAGCVRQNNEDCAGHTFVLGGRTDFVAVLADGMGGYEGGEVASGMMVNTVCADSGKLLKDSPLKWLKNAVAKANAMIYDAAQRSRIVMGTTCTILLVWKRKLYCAHIGDSRLYLLENNKLQQMTTDHTLVGEMLRQKKITEAEAALHQQRNVLVKAVGTKPDVKPDVFKIKQTIKPGSRFMLCSDGVYDMLSDVEIGQILSGKSIRESVSSLIANAREKGGYDNLTVTVIEINDAKKLEYND
ncbi:MAG: Stp1/IreP family PP2C-type Ser/Thr phosphatase [Tannerella sp.]|jgi:protein phosphatase|nr:Stp1/IreP family PP2C-type Ser/Thr phosphatase [Tannerella sp.]